MTVHPGKIGKYEILGEVGKGAMGMVHRARDPVLDRLVALKTMFGASSVEPEAKERFLREARSVARLQHPNIITIYELGEVDGTPFIAMEYLDGQNLADAVRHGKLRTLKETIAVIDQLCRGLHYAHERGVIHRDIKPSNIFILPDGTAKVLDFGIARLEGGTFATRTGIVLGTPSYMAPELFSDGDVDERVDMWGVGVIFYELITGRRPFDADSVPALVFRIVHTVHPEIDAGELSVPASVVEIIDRALAKQPGDRFENLGEMGEAVRRCLGGSYVPAADAQLETVDTPSRELHGTSGTGLGSRPLSRRLATGDVMARTQSAAGTQPALRGAPTGATAELKVGEGATLSASSFQDLGVFGERAGLQVIAVSPNEEVLAVGGIDGSIRLWSPNTCMKTSTLRSRMHLRTGHAAMTTSLAFSSDGALLAAGHLDGSIYLWEPDSGLELEARLRHEGSVNGLDFTSDAAILVSGAMDCTLKLWDMEAVHKGEAQRQLRRQPADCTALTTSFRGRSVISGHSNLSIRVHDTASGRLTGTFHGNKAAPSALAVAPRNDLLLSGSRDGAIRLFRMDSRVQLRIFRGHHKTVSSLCFFPDGRHFASVAMDHALMIWNVASPEPVVTLWGATDESLASLCILTREPRLLCGLADGRIRVWEYASGTTDRR